MPFPLIISAIALVVFIVIVIRIYPLLIVIISKWLFGKYSFKYLVFHKKFLGTSPYGYCIKEDFINHIAGFYKKTDNQNKLKTNIPILFGTTKFGEKFDTILKESQKLVCLNAIRLPQFELKIAGYRSHMFNFEMKTYYYFANNRFFMGEYSFKVPDDEKINEISYIVQKKYLEVEQVFNEDFIIENENQAVIRFEHNGFHLSVKYLDLANKSLVSLLNQYWESNVRQNPGNPGNFESELKSKL